MPKIILVANTDWYLYNFRLALAKHLRKEGYEVLLLSPSGKYAAKLQAAGFRWQAWEIGRKSVNPIGELRALLALRRILRRENADVVHLHTIKAVLYGSVAAWLAGVPKVVRSITGRGYVFLGRDVKARLVRPLVTLIYKFALRFPRGLTIFENENDRDFFLRAGLLPAERSVIIRGVGVDVQHYRPLPEPAEPPLVLLASRMLWDKGIADFVAAARLLRGQVAARFVLAGAPDEGNPANIPAETLAAWQAEGVIEYWGWQEDMRALFAQCHLVTLPSYGEGVPTVLLEAAACARPLVATDVPGCRDVVQAGVNGLLVPPKSPQALSAALKKLIENPHMRQEMGAQGRKMMVETFAVEKIIAETIAVYKG